MNCLGYRFLLVASFIFIASSGIVLAQATTVGTTSTNKNTLYTPGAGNNRIIVVAVTGRILAGAVSNVTGITWGGQSLTFAVAQTSTLTRMRTEIWYLDEVRIRAAGYCTSGAFTINWSVSTPATELFAVMTLKDVDQTSPIPATGTKVNGATTATTATNLALPALTQLVANDLVVYASSMEASRTHTASAGYTQNTTQSSTASMATATKGVTVTTGESPTATWSGAANVINIAGVAFRGVAATIVPPAKSTFYSLTSGGWDANTSWSYSTDGSSGAVPAGVWPRRADNVVIKTGHTITVDNTADNKTCGISPDGLGRGNVSSAGNPFAGSNLNMFYHTGDIMIKGTLAVTGEIMLENYTQIQTGGHLQASSTLVVIGSFEADAGSMLTVLDDLVLTGASSTTINTTSVSADDLIFSYNAATLCGTGSQTLVNGSGSAVNFVNGSSAAQICTGFVVNCTGAGCTGFPVAGTGNPGLAGNSGPGGVGNAATNKLWLRASDLALTNGARVANWNDVSGNGLIAAAQTPVNVANQPTFVANAVNTLPAINFAGTNWLTFGNNSVLNFTPLTHLWSFFCVYNVGGGQTGTFMSKASNANTQYSYFFSSNSLSSSIGGNQSIGPNSSANAWTVGTHMNGTVTKSSWQNATINVQGHSVSGATSPGMDVLIGARRGSSNNDTAVPLTGNIAEIAMFNNYLSDAEREIVENYLAARYGVALLTALDRYTMDDPANGNFDFDVIGMSRDFNNRYHRDSKGGLLRIWNPNSLDQGDHFYVGHNGSSPSPTTTDVDGTLIQQRINRVWRVSEIAGDAGMIMLSFDVVSFINVALGSNLRLMIDRDGDGFADNDVAPIAGTFSDNTVVFSGINLQHGDRFTLGNTNLALPLPIELLDFSAEFEKSSVVLTWSTATEKNNDFFEVMRSHNGEEWSVIGTVKGSGNTTSVQHYQRVDSEPLTQYSYYRLKQVDFDGAFSFSNVIRVFNPNEREIVVHPNPSDRTFIIDGLSEYDMTNVRLFDVVGKQIPVSIEWKSSTALLDTGDIPPGIYFIRFADGSRTRSIRVVKK